MGIDMHGMMPRHCLTAVCSVLHVTGSSLPAGSLPWAVFEVSSGTLLLRQELLLSLQSSPVEATAVLVNACSKTIQSMVKQLRQVTSLHFACILHMMHMGASLHCACAGCYV